MRIDGRVIPWPAVGTVARLGLGLGLPGSFPSSVVGSTGRSDDRDLSELHELESAVNRAISTAWLPDSTVAPGSTYLPRSPLWFCQNPTCCPGGGFEDESPQRMKWLRACSAQNLFDSSRDASSSPLSKGSRGAAGPG